MINTTSCIIIINIITYSKQVTWVKKKKYNETNKIHKVLHLLDNN